MEEMHNLTRGRPGQTNGAGAVLGRKRLPALPGMQPGAEQRLLSHMSCRHTLSVIGVCCWIFVCLRWPDSLLLLPTATTTWWM
jgi:hypothetical protein